jgi:hypothetical protein
MAAIYGSFMAAAMNIGHFYVIMNAQLNEAASSDMRQFKK